jgi:hypothetical protein
MISWQQWSKRWGSWSGWRANCPTFRQDAIEPRPGLTAEEPSDRVVRQRRMWRFPGRKKEMNYLSTASRSMNLRS